MKTYASCAAALTIAAILAGCGGGSGMRFSDLFDDSAAAEGTGIQGFGLIRAVVILATHEATARQRRVAQQNGRRAVAQLKERLASREEKVAASAEKPRRKKKSVVSKTKPESDASAEKPSEETEVARQAPEPEPAKESTLTEKERPREELPRIIAVATEKNEKTDEKAAQAVMLFDTYSQEIVGNKVYDIEREPRKGDAVRFETYSSIYIGASL